MTKNLIMTDCFEIKGKWFLTNDDCNKIPGTLCYSPKQIELKLIGMFEDRLSRLQCDDPSKSIIYGLSDDGKCFTLVDCIPSHALLSTCAYPLCPIRGYRGQGRCGDERYQRHGV